MIDAMIYLTIILLKVANQTTNLDSWIGPAVIGAIVAVVGTYFGNLHLKKLEFKHNWQSELIKIRLQYLQKLPSALKIYNEVTIRSNLQNQLKLTETNVKLNEAYANFNDDLVPLLAWYNADLVTGISRLHALLEATSSLVHIRKLSFFEAGVFLYETFIEEKRKVFKILESERQNINDIKAFQKKNNLDSDELNEWRNRVINEVYQKKQQGATVKNIPAIK